MEQGFDNLEKIAQAKQEDLMQIKGLGEVKAAKMIQEAKKLIKQYLRLKVIKPADPTHTRKLILCVYPN